MANQNGTVIRKIDLLWIFAYPFYQIVSTFRHEAGHALAAILNGQEVLEFVFWPSVTEWGFMWGYVVYTGENTAFSLFMPYFIDFLTFVPCFVVCMLWVTKARWAWINVMVFGIISPFINSFFNYRGGFHKMNDVGELLTMLPPWMAHGYFIFTLLVYLAGWVVVNKWSRMAEGQMYLRKNP